MKLVRLDPAPALLGIGVLAPAAPALEVTASLPAACGEWAGALRRADRYGALGFAAARLALLDAGLGPPPAVDPEWGVMIGSALGCWGSNARHHGAMRGAPGLDPSPAVFVRTVSNAVNGDISIAWRLGGPAATFVSGWTAGAEALIAAGAAISGGRARRMLAGGVEAPEGPFRTMHAAARLRRGGEWLPATLAEGAAIALLGDDGAPGALRLRAFARGTDPSGRWSLAGLLGELDPLPIRCVAIANLLPPPMRARIQDEAGDRQFIDLPGRTGEIGAAGAVAAIAMAEAARVDRSPGGIVVLARGAEGGVAVLALAG
jgi:hypothetical protein